VLARSVAWRGETLPPRTLHLLGRLAARTKIEPTEPTDTLEQRTRPQLRELTRPGLR